MFLAPLAVQGLWVVGAAAQDAPVAYDYSGAAGGCCSTGQHPNNGFDGGAGRTLQETLTHRNVSSDGAAGISIVTSGGVGGDGKNSDENHWGGNGGASGAISFQLQNSTVNASAAAALNAVANGGNGGEYANNSAFEGASYGNGGAGGSVNLTISWSTLQSVLYGISATSNGGLGQRNSKAVAGYDYDAGNGGNGGSVSVTLRDSKLAVHSGDKSGAGVFAESVGGAGGEASYSGGSGDAHTGYGGNGGNVSVNFASGEISTLGAAMNGIWARSAGGNAGYYSGGKHAIVGRPGGNSGTVTVSNSGIVHIVGDGTSDVPTAAILTSTEGGKGAESGTSSGGTGTGYTGGNGGNAGLITVTNAGSLTTAGTYANGIVASAIAGDGGRGGNGGVSSGGPGGDGGTAVGVQIANSGNIATQGDFSSGIVTTVQGGKGGDGGKDGTSGHGGRGGAGGGDAGTFDLTINNSGDIATQGAQSFGIFGSTVGGGAGVGGNGVGIVAIGGAGGSAANGGGIKLTNSGAITTKADHSDAILLQSTGGGGGAGGDANALGIWISVAVGGKAGSGGNGGDINAQLTDGTDIETAGANSAGIKMQSIGGGGGNGGSASSRSFGLGVAADVAVGGSGGSAGNGGNIDFLLQKGTIATLGSFSQGVFAQAVGGGGGNAGLASTDTVVTAVRLGPNEANGSMSVNIAVGGNGGEGGEGGIVTVKNGPGGVITTDGMHSDAILAQSIGGGGGSGGDAGVPRRPIVTTIPLNKFPTFNLGIGVAVGGSGGGGGNGLAVTVSNDLAGKIQTEGTASYGISAQSIGGGGGSGGEGQLEGEQQLTSALSGLGGTIASGLKKIIGMLQTPSEKPKPPDKDKIDIASLTIIPNVAVGGSGGSGGSGGTVTVNNAGFITTSGNQSAGISAQGIGGGGGIGGTAGAGGTSALSTSLLGFVNTMLGLSNQLFAWNPTISPIVTVGGSGGSGGNGGVIAVTNSGQVRTTGTGSAGIIAQSIGGGGGVGTVEYESILQSFRKWTKDTEILNNISTIIQLLASKGWALGGLLSIDIGGSNGASGDGGFVRVDASAQSSQVVTFGASAPGILAQSIGGGGGIGITSSELDVAGGEVSHQVSVGAGKGGASGNSDTVTVANGGLVQTGGMNSAGIIAQSIAGGGGISLLNMLEKPLATVAGGGAPQSVSMQVGATGAVLGGQLDGASVINTGTVHTQGLLSHGIIAQSIVGGGGIASVILPDNVSVATPKVTVGSTVESFSAQAGKSVVDVGGSVLTGGALSYGVLAQSIGGGGGYASIIQGAQPFASTMEVRLGGTIGDANNVDVSVDRTGYIATKGQNSVGILGQSIGGGGGVASLSAEAGLINLQASSIGFGNGGNVDINVAGQVSTAGNGAGGVVAQSIGGGGGLAGDMAALSFGKDILKKGPMIGVGTGGAINVGVNGSVWTSGENAPAILAMSLGGGGVLTDGGLFIGGAGGTGGAIDVAVGAYATVGATGKGSSAIFAVSAANADGSGGSDISVNIGRNGQVIGGSGDLGTAITTITEGQSSIVNAGLIAALSGTAIRTTGSVHIDNTGTMVGDIDLKGANSVFNNGVEALFYSGSDVSLGTNGQLINSGVINPGGSWNYVHTTINGAFTQTASGVYAPDVDFLNRTGDFLTVNGASVIDGKMSPVIHNPMPGVEVAVAHFDQAPGGAGAFQIETSSPVFSYHVAGDSQSPLVSVTGNFVPAGVSLGSDERGVANYLQTLWNSGSAAVPYVFNYLTGLNSQASYASTLRAISDDVDAVQSALRVQQSYKFLNSLMSCPRFIDGGTRLGEGECYWGRVVGGAINRGATGDDLGYQSNLVTMQMGAQSEFAPDWFVGGSLAYTRSSTNGDGGSVRNNTDSIDAGLTVKHQIGPWLLAAAVKAGHFRSDVRRDASLPGFPFVAQSHPDGYTVGSRFRASYEAAFQNVYIKPFVDFDVNYTHQNAYRETGAGYLDLAADAASNTSLMVTPSVEIGSRFRVHEATLRPYLIAGVSFQTNSSWTTRFQLADFAGMLPGFDVVAKSPNTFADLTAGMELYTDLGVNFRAEYGTRAADKYLDQRFTVRAAAPF